MTDQQFSIWLQQLSTGGAAGGAPSGGPGGGGGYQPPRPGGIPGGYGGGMGATSPTRQFTPQAGGGLWPGGAYPSYGRQLEGMRDFTSGPRRAEDLVPGYHGQNVISTDRPLPGELGNPNMGPGTLYPKWGEPAASNDTAFFPGANIEPPDLPANVGGNGSWPFDVRDFPNGYPDVPGQVQIGTEYNPVYEPGGGGGPSPFFDPFETPQQNDFGFGPDLFGGFPGSPDFTPSDAFLPSPPEQANVMDPGGYVYDPNSYTPFTDFPGGNQPTPGRGGFDPMSGGDPFGTGGSVAFGDNTGREGIDPMFGGDQFGGEGSAGFGDNPNFNYASGPNGETYVYDQDWNWVGQTPGGGTAPSSTAGGGTPPAPGSFTPNTSAPNQPAFQNMPQMTWDLGHNIYADPNAGQPGLMDELRQPTNWKDALGNIRDVTGKVIASAADLAKGIGGSLSNIGKSIADSFPNDLGGFGKPMGYFPSPGDYYRPEGPMGIPMTGGVGGAGGTVANFGIRSSDIAASGVSPTYGGNRSSVPAPQGGMNFMGGGSYANPAALGGYNNRGRMLAERIRQSIMAGTYRPKIGPPPSYKYAAPDLVNAFMKNAAFMKSQGFGKTFLVGSPEYNQAARLMDWGAIGRNMKDYYANRDREDVMGSAIGVGTRGFGTPHAHTPQTNPT